LVQISSSYRTLSSGRFFGRHGVGHFRDKSFQSVNHLHWYWKPNQNKRETNA